MVGLLSWPWGFYEVSPETEASHVDQAGSGGRSFSFRRARRLSCLLLVSPCLYAEHNIVFLSQALNTLSRSWLHTGVRVLILQVSGNQYLSLALFFSFQAPVSPSRNGARFSLSRIPMAIRL